MLTLLSGATLPAEELLNVAVSSINGCESQGGLRALAAKSGAKVVP